MSGYTMIANTPMRDHTLSLRAKGVYACIASFAGLPGFSLNAARISRACADSLYSVRLGLRELTEHGYLTHYCSAGAGRSAFAHAYDVRDTQGTHTGIVFLPQSDRPNGDVKLIRTKQGDYTPIPTAILRDPKIPLRTKAIYGITKYLFSIPGFHFSVGAVSRYCKEGSKALRAAWQGLKLAGLLKQHRHPTGIHNAFHYEYELRDNPDMETPHLTTYRADGSPAVAVSIRQSIARLKGRSVVFKAAMRLLGLVPAGAGPLPSPAGLDAAGLLQEACQALRSGRRLYVDGKRLTKSRRRRVIEMLDHEGVDAISAGIRLPDNVQHPLQYVVTSLVRLADKRACQTPDDALTLDEAELIVNHRIRQLRKKGEKLTDQEQEYIAEYDAVQRLSPSKISAALMELAMRWIKRK